MGGSSSKAKKKVRAEPEVRVELPRASDPPSDAGSSGPGGSAATIAALREEHAREISALEERLRGAEKRALASGGEVEAQHQRETERVDALHKRELETLREQIRGLQAASSSAAAGHKAEVVRLGDEQKKELARMQSISELAAGAHKDEVARLSAEFKDACARLEAETKRLETRQSEEMGRQATAHAEEVMRLGSEAESARGRHEAELSALREHHTSEVDLCQQARRASDPRPSGRIGRHHPSLYALSRHRRMSGRSTSLVSTTRQRSSGSRRSTTPRSTRSRETTRSSSSCAPRVNRTERTRAPRDAIANPLPSPSPCARPRRVSPWRGAQV